MFAYTRKEEAGRGGGCCCYCCCVVVVVVVAVIVVAQYRLDSVFCHEVLAYSVSALHFGGRGAIPRSQKFVQTPSLSDETKNRGPSFRRCGYGLCLVTLPSTKMKH